MLTADELLAGSGLTFEVQLPAEVLRPEWEEEADGRSERGSVRLRPLTVHDLQLIANASEEDEALVGTLMVQRALVEPEMTVAQVAAAHVGLVQYLLHEVNRVSGIAASEDELARGVREPLARAAFVLEREFGWTPEQVSELTVGQMLLHLQMLGERPAA
jgi:hypothetical protein